MPRDDCDLVLVPLEAIELGAEFANVEDLYLVVTTPSREPITVDRVPSNLVDRRIVRVNLIDVASTESRVPNLHILVLASRQDEGLGRVPITRLQVGSVLREFKLLLRCDKIEHFGSPIVSARDEFE